MNEERVFEVSLTEPIIHDEKLSRKVFIRAETFCLNPDWVVFYTDHGKKSVASFNKDMVITII